MSALSTHGQAHGRTQATTGTNGHQAGAAFPLETARIDNGPKKACQCGCRLGVERTKRHVRGHAQLGRQEACTSPANTRHPCQAYHQGASLLSGALGKMGVTGGGACHRGGKTVSKKG